MTLGQLFILFGVKVDKSQFKAAHDAIHALRAAAAVSGVVDLARGITHMAVSAAESATHVVSLSQAMGMTIEQTQRWGYVAQQSGSNIEQFSVGITMALGNLRKLAQGQLKGQLAAVFQAMHTSAADARAALAGPQGLEAWLLKVAAQVQRMGNTGQTAALMRGIFGSRAAKAMTADLARGPEGLRELMAHFREIGGVVDDQAVLNIRQFNNALNDLKVSWHAAFATVLGSLAPMLVRLLEDTAKWIAENRELLGGAFAAAIYVLAGAFTVVTSVIEGFATVFREAFVEANPLAMGAVAGLTFLLLVLATTIVTTVIPALWALVAPTLAALWPYLLIAAAVAAVVAAIAYLIKYWDEVVAFVNEHPLVLFAVPIIGPILAALLLIRKHWDMISDAIRRAARAVWAAFVDSMYWLHDRIGEVGAWFSDLGLRIWHGLGAMWDLVVSKARAAWDSIVEAAEGAWLRIRNLPVIKQLFDVAGIAAPPVVTELADGVQRPQTSVAPLASRSLVTNVPPSYAAAARAAASSAADRGPANVSVGPTTINLYGVKDATEAKDGIADSIDGVHRHAAAALNAEVQ